MPYPVYPAELDGDELDRWYRRSPQEVEAERQAAEAQRYQAFFGVPPDRDLNSGFDRELPETDIDPGFSKGSGLPKNDVDPRFAWTSVGPNRWRAEPLAAQTPVMAPSYGNSGDDQAAYLDRGGAGPSDGAQLVLVGNPHNPRLRREWERANGKPWPKTDDGRNYDVAHNRAVADGGSNTLDNIQPMHPDAHRAQHIENGDAARWGRRPSIARTFGGRVEPPTPPRARVNGLGILGILPNITGILSGRIRTDTPMHTLYDLAGFPAPDDYPPLSA